MSKKLSACLAVLCVLAIGLSATSLIVTLSRTDKKVEDEAPVVTTATTEEEKDIQYVMFLGTNDSESNTPVFPLDEAKEKAEAILIEFFGGYTVSEAEGGWIDGDTVYQENTIVIYLSDTNLEQVHKAADKLIEVFHQSSVMIQSNPTTTEFYYSAAKEG